MPSHGTMSEDTQKEAPLSTPSKSNAQINDGKSTSQQHEGGSTVTIFDVATEIEDMLNDIVS